MADLIAPGSVTEGQQVTNAGTEIALTAGVCRTVVIKALPTNGGNVFIGNAVVTAGTGFILQPGESVALSVSNRNLVFFDVAVNGEGVCWISVA